MRSVKESKGLKVGDKVKDFIGVDQNGESIQLFELLVFLLIVNLNLKHKLVLLVDGLSGNRKC